MNIIPKVCFAMSLISAAGLNAQCFDFGDGAPKQADGSPCNNTITTALPFLRIVPDARFGALGDAGIALAPDPNSLHFNASNIVFAEKDAGVSVSYTPWLRALGLNDVYLAHLSMYKNIDKFQSVAGSLRFFSLGSVQYTDDQGNPLQQVRPREFELNFAYSRKLTKYFSTGLGVKYIYSYLGQGATSAGDILRPANAFGADLSFTYKRPLKFKNKKEGTFTAGLALTNLGSKVSYTQSANRDYQPANFGLGTAFEYFINEHNSITFALDINKLMVPTPIPGAIRTVDSAGNEVTSVNPAYDAKGGTNGGGDGIPDYKQKGVPESIFSSFGDASFQEEMRELAYSFAMEYWYNKQFSFRLGHFNEHKTKGNRKFVTVGLGIKYSVFTLNLSYLLPTFNSQRNPLDNTLRFSMVMEFGESKANPPRKVKPPKPIDPTPKPVEPEIIEGDDN